ncbi:hypothetical protein IKR55_00600 [bacterium]|nr:hypothetical protein [bacterium]
MYKNLSLILVLSLLLTACGKPEKDPDCLIETKELCITKISKSYNIGGNYWEGAKELCGGAQNLPKATDLTKIAALVYEGEPRFPADELKTGLKPTESFKYFDLNKTGSFMIFSEETEQAKKYVYIRNFYKSQTDWKSIDSTAGSDVVTVCIKH